MKLLSDFAKQAGLFLWLFLSASCSAGPKNTVAATPAPAPAADTLRLPNPCDPQPPCAPPNSQTFDFRFVLDPALKASGSPAILASSKKPDGRNNLISISANATREIFTATFFNPLQLDEDSDGVFHFFLNTGSGPLKELTLKTKKEKVGCCPQIVIREIHLGNTVICNPCPGESQPVTLK